MTDNALPVKLTPQPLVSAAVQIQVSSSLADAELFGALSDGLSEFFPRVEEVSSTADGSTILRRSGDEFVVDIGSGVLTFDCPDEYVGWVCYMSFLSKVLPQLLSRIEHAGFVRAALRYISFFPGEQAVSEVLRVDVTLPSEVGTGRTWFRRAFSLDDTDVELTAADGVAVEENAQSGVLLDLRVTANAVETESTDDLLQIVDSLHSVEKRLFFQLLQRQTLATLNPEYS